MKEVWDHWDDETKQLFYYNYGDLPYLLDVKVDKHVFRALALYWNPAYSCFTFRKVDLVPTMEEYKTLLRCPRIQADKAYSRAANVSTFLKKLMSITGMKSEEKGRYLRLEYLRVGHLPQSVRAHKMMQF
ncbi:hypothetical protein Gotri_000583 [Gossypium trilobum]|uniref:DUF7745 domain-containing protein n=1 Tax=Gossypium trilobum TaxID=34281 RepID=A0A7J9FDV8_9ROSI|nr:hypothetical protein [Gossypium trilobum]